MNEYRPSVSDFDDYVASVELASYVSSYTYKRLIALIRIYDKGVTFKVFSKSSDPQLFDILADAIDYYNTL